jgi:hypothetical protein
MENCLRREECLGHQNFQSVTMSYSSFYIPEKKNSLTYSLCRCHGMKQLSQTWVFGWVQRNSLDTFNMHYPQMQLNIEL